MTVRLKSPSELDALRATLDADPGWSLEAKRVVAQLKLLRCSVDVLELRIAVGMRGSLAGLTHCPQTVPKLTAVSLQGARLCCAGRGVKGRCVSRRLQARLTRRMSIGGLSRRS